MYKDFKAYLGVAGFSFSAENVRMLVMLAFGFCGYTLIKSQMRGLEYSLNKRIDGVEKRIDGVENGMEGMKQSLLRAIDEKIATANQSLYAQLKANDFKHLNDTIEALTFTLSEPELPDSYRSPSTISLPSLRVYLFPNQQERP